MRKDSIVLPINLNKSLGTVDEKVSQFFASASPRIKIMNPMAEKRVSTSGKVGV